MATLYGVNNLKGSTPNQLIPAGDLGGKIKCAYDEYTTVANMDVGDVINFMTIPAGARVVGAQIHHQALGDGELDVGHAASKNEDGSTLSADPDAFLLDVNCAAAGFARETGLLAGHLKKFGAETLITVTLKNHNTSSGAGEKIKVAIFYVLD